MVSVMGIQINILWGNVMKQSDAVTYLEKVAGVASQMYGDTARMSQDLINAETESDFWLAIQKGNKIANKFKKVLGDPVQIYEAVFALIGESLGISSPLDIPQEYSSVLVGVADLYNPLGDLSDYYKIAVYKGEGNDFLSSLSHDDNVQSILNSVDAMKKAPSVVDEVIDKYLNYYDDKYMTLKNARMKLYRQLQEFVNEFNALGMESTNEQLYNFIDRYEDFVNSFEPHTSANKWSDIEKKVYPLFDKARNFIDKRAGAGSPNGGDFGRLVNNSYDILVRSNY